MVIEISVWYARSTSTALMLLTNTEQVSMRTLEGDVFHLKRWSKWVWRKILMDFG
jgi:hypothetical protein